MVKCLGDPYRLPLRFYFAHQVISVRRASTQWMPRPTKRPEFFAFIRSRSKDGSFWRFEKPGDSHTSDIGHWFRMTRIFSFSA